MLAFWYYIYLYYWNKAKIKFLSKLYLFCSITIVFQILVSAWNVQFFLLNVCLTILNSLLKVILQIETIILFPSPYTLSIYIYLHLYILSIWDVAFRKCVKKYKDISLCALFNNKHWLKNKLVTMEFYGPSYSDGQNVDCKILTSVLHWCSLGKFSHFFPYICIYLRIHKFLHVYLYTHVKKDWCMTGESDTMWLMWDTQFMH